MKNILLGDFYPVGTKVIYEDGYSTILTGKSYLKTGNYHLGKKIVGVDNVVLSPEEIANQKRDTAEQERIDKWLQKYDNEEELRKEREAANARHRDLGKRGLLPPDKGYSGEGPPPPGAQPNAGGGSKSRRGQKRKKSRKGRSRKRHSSKTSRRRGRR